MMRFKIETLEIDILTVTHKYISSDVPLEVLNDYNSYRPYLINVNEFSSEIKERDTVTRRMKFTLTDEMEPKGSGNYMASYWRMWIAQNLNYRGKIIRYSRRVEEDEQLALKFTGTIENITIGTNGTITIEAVDLLKALSKIDYPILSGLTLENDLSAVWPVESYSEIISLSDAEINDLAKAPFTLFANYSSTDAEVDFNAQEYNFQIAVYLSGEVVALSNIVTIDMTGHTSGGECISLYTNLLNILGSDNYKVFWNDSGTSKLVAEGGFSGWGGTIIIYDMNESFSNEDPPDVEVEGYVFFELQAEDYSDIDNWDLIPLADQTVDLIGDPSLLDDNGYIMIDKEIIYYSHVATDSEGCSLVGVIRAVFETDSLRHSAGAVVFYILCVNTPTDAFDELKHLLSLAAIPSEYISTKFDDYAAAGILDVQCLPIIKSTKLSEIYYDLINLVDCISFENEDGQIDVLKNTEMPVEFVEITDEANIIFNSAQLDLNEDSRFTRWVLYWMRVDIEKNLTDAEAYLRGNLTVDGDAEDYYEDVRQDVQYTAWLTAASEAEINAAISYVDDLLDLRRLRTNAAQWILTVDLEIKDDAIKLAQLVKIQTKKVLDESGDDQLLIYRAIYKQPSGNKIKFKFLRILSTAVIEIFDFDGEFDDTKWRISYYEGNPGDGWQIATSYLIGSYGVLLTGSQINMENYGYHQLTTLYRSSEGDITVEATIFKANTTGNRTIMMGIWEDVNHFAGICIDNVYNDNKVSLIICDNASDDRGVFSLLVDLGLSCIAETKYKLKFERDTGTITPYYWDGSQWSQLYASQVVSDFINRDFYSGIFGGIFNTDAGGSVYGKDLKVIYNPNIP